MCTFVMTVLPPNADLAALMPLFEKHHLGFRPVPAPTALEEVAPKDVLIQTTPGICDCTTPLGSLRGRFDTGTTDQQREKLRKKGWSAAKIARWQQQKSLEQEKQERIQSAKAERAQPQLEDWTEFLTEVLRSGHTSRFGLLLLWSELQYDGRRVILQEDVSLGNLSAERLLSMEEDTVYQFHR